MVKADDSTLRRIRLSDVAKHAGVAASTASAALSGGRGVADSTRARVLTAADELRYDGPDPWARALRTRQSPTICVISELAGQLLNPAHVLRLLNEISACAQPLGGFVMWLPLDGNSASRLQHVPIIGAIAMGELSENVLLQLEHNRVRFVSLDLDAQPDEIARGVSRAFSRGDQCE